MKVDTALEANAVVYKLNYPDSLADKISGNRLNISFGPYRVTDADVSWTRTGSQAEDPDPFFTFKNTRKSGNTTTTTKLGVGPTSIFGFSRPAAEGEPSINKSSQTITYKFKVSKDITWNALCSHRAEKRVTQYENTNAVEILWSNFTCQYTAENKTTNNKSNSEIWTLSVDYGGPITMTQNEKPNTLFALSTGGKYVMPKGQETKFTTGTAGYTWRQINNGTDKSVAAISVREETPRVWLHKGNSDTINHVLSMANTGLLIYSWEINH
ncbi:MAG: hypothetical protein KAJ39_08865 [Gammaproteobacteria bacterium]|nr:hypothetical protein [Gammaproteobacteria bacterium]